MSGESGTETSHSRPPRGSGGRGGGNHHGAGGSESGFGQGQGQPPPAIIQQQDFSWGRNPMADAAAAGMPPDAYNSFYYSSGYTPFSPGDMRDSIAAIWSRNSPSGEGVAAFSGGYGQFPDTSTGQFAANSATAGQFAANLTGHYPTSDLSMFGAGGEYSAAAAYGQQYNYNNQYTQWGDNNASGNSGRNGNSSYSYLGGGGGNEDPRGHRERVNDVQHGIDGMRLGLKKGESNGYQQSQPKKMSWANVASQPAKPQAPTTKTKKPGVLPPPAIIPSAKPVVAGAPTTAPGGSSTPPTMPPMANPVEPQANDNGPPFMGMAPNHGPPPMAGMGHPTEPKHGGGMGNSHGREDSGPPPRSNMANNQ